MLLIELLILLLLLSVFIQDIKSRAVYWVLFPGLAGMFVVLRILQHQQIKEFWQPVLFNIGFLAVQMLMVSLWFSIKNKSWVNVTARFIGLGDILLLISMAFYLSFLNFLFFYIASLIIVLMTWIGWQLLFNNKDKQIPLAGMQALTLVIYLANDWWLNHLNVTSDYWLQRLLIK